MPFLLRPDCTRCAAEIVDFDEVLLAACSPRERRELALEAELLASVFAPQRTAIALQRIARQLRAAEQGMERDRARIRRLTATVRRMARAA